MARVIFAHVDFLQLLGYWNLISYAWGIKYNNFSGTLINCFIDKLLVHVNQVSSGQAISGGKGEETNWLKCSLQYMEAFYLNLILMLISHQMTSFVRLYGLRCDAWWGHDLPSSFMCSIYPVWWIYFGTRQHCLTNNSL